MEAGNRCYDDRVPEEINRRIIDHCSDVLMPYTQRSKENLLREGIRARADLRDRQSDLRSAAVITRRRSTPADVLERLGVAPTGFFLATLHRAENVDDEQRLRGFVDGARSRRRRSTACRWSSASIRARSTG